MYKLKNWWHGYLILHVTYENGTMDLTKYSILFCFLVHSFHHTSFFVHSQDLHNSNLGLTTKIKARQGVQVKKVFWNLNTFYKCEKVNPNTSKWIFILELISLSVLNCFWNYETKSCDLHFVAKLRINRVQVIFDII